VTGRRAIAACITLAALAAAARAQEPLRQVELEVPGFNAPEVDASVTVPILAALRGAQGVQLVGAVSEPGRATIYARGPVGPAVEKLAPSLPPEVSRPHVGPVQKRATWGPHLVVEVDEPRLDAHGFEPDDVRRALLRADGAARPEEVGGLVIGMRESTPIRLMDVAGVKRAEPPVFELVIAVADETPEDVERRLADLRRTRGGDVVAAFPQERADLHVALERERVASRGTSFPAALLRTADARAAGFVLVRSAKTPRVEGAVVHPRGALPVEVRVLLGMGAD